MKRIKKKRIKIKPMPIVEILPGIVLMGVLLGMLVWVISESLPDFSTVYAQEITGEVLHTESPETSDNGENSETQEEAVTTESTEISNTENTEEAESSENVGGTEDTEISESTEVVDGTESIEEPESPKCICMDTCVVHRFNAECEVCNADFEKCTYISPNVKIAIITPSGWHNESAKVEVSVSDTINSGNFTIQSVKAKISQNGSWTDITEDMFLEISEDSSVYVLVTDQKGKTYERNRYISCFDKEKPVLNAAISSGLLSIQAHDTASGVKAVYVNGYEFTELTNGTLNIRLQQFDAGYEYFTIQAMDNAGNMSEVYKTENPYYTNPETENNTTGKNPAEQLPESAEPDKPSNATGTVTGHNKVDSAGEEMEKSNASKEFYTIQTESEKTFYLIIDRTGESETVYFLTEIDENDLLNVTEKQSETLPKNSAALESAIPTGNEELLNKEESSTEVVTETENSTPEDMAVEKQETETPKDNSTVVYIVLAVVCVMAVGIGYYLKVYKKKEENFEEDEEEENEGWTDDALDDEESDSFLETEEE